jgi:uncharacterized protein (UPF0248 family)
MIKEFRDKYNSEFRQETYEKFIKYLNDLCGHKIEFRIAETPIFVPDQLFNEIIQASEELTSVIPTKEFKDYTENAIPPGLETPNEEPHPSLLSLDFAICKGEDGKLHPQLIELQGFASLYCYQELLNEAMRKFFWLPDGAKSYFYVKDHEEYVEQVRKSIVGDADPENVILMDIDPVNQKTYIDFLATEKYIGIKSVCLSDIIKRGRKLYYINDGKEIPIDRIYNRVINDELERRKDVKYNFSFQDDLDLKWVAHPNWFYRLSKYSMPYFKSKYVPETRFLSEFEKFPDDLENYVLKPLFSFAVVGVRFDVDRALLDSIKDRENYILQRKVVYEPIIQTPDVPAKAELRLLYVWDDKPLLLNNLVRLSKGKMMGVDFNKDQTWVGSSIAYHSRSF